MNHLIFKIKIYIIKFKGKKYNVKLRFTFYQGQKNNGKIHNYKILKEYLYKNKSYVYNNIQIQVEALRKLFYNIYTFSYTINH